MIPLIDNLNRPYPLIERSKICTQSFFIGLFVFLFLFLFQPFGLHEAPWELLLKVTLIYGLISFGVTFIWGQFLQRAFPGFANEDSWTIGREFLHIVCIIALIAVANYYYTAYMNFAPFSWPSFLWMFVSTVGIGAIAVVGIVGIEANRALKKHLAQAQHMNDKIGAPVSVTRTSEHKIYLPSEVEKQSFNVEMEQLVCLVSEANYIACYHLDESENLQCSKIRNRMKVISPLLEKHKQFFRCHRAFLVNMDFVESVEGNAKGYVLSLRGIDLEVPVTRSKSADLRQLLK